MSKTKNRKGRNINYLTRYDQSCLPFWVTLPDKFAVFLLSKIDSNINEKQKKINSVR